MTQDGSIQARRQRIKQALRPAFEASLDRLAQVMAEAEDGHVIEQVEMPVFDELNRLKRQASEVGLQERVLEAEDAFSPSGQQGKARQQRRAKQ